MDTSKEYIKMSECAYKDIGEHSVLYKDILPNLWAIKLKDKNKIVYQTTESRNRPRVDERMYKTNPWFPLYRQDQLQEMVKNEVAKTLRDFFVFNMSDYRDKQPAHLFNSMEQLWLAFVMKEKHNKTWNGKDWINE